MSISAAGWLGGDMYGHRDYQKGVFVPSKGVLPTPYPIGAGSFITVPSGWTFGNHGNTYKIPRWGLRPYGPFISNYYSNLGWCYQRRRTWHGITYSAIRPPISKNRQTSKQAGRQWLFASAVRAWQSFAENQKDVYNRWRYPARASGYNRFIRWFMRLGPTMPLYWGNLQRSDTDPTPVEDAAVMQHDPHIHYPFQFYNMQAFNMVLHKGGGFPADPVSGQLFYRSDLDKIYKWDGAAWEEVGAGAGGENYYSPTVIVAKDATGDYSDIQTAIDALPAGGGRVFVKEGTYTISASITITKSNVVIEGQGDATIIDVGAAMDADAIIIGDGGTDFANITLKNFKIDGNSAGQASGRGIFLNENLSDILIQGVHLFDIKDTAIYNLVSAGRITIAYCKLEITGQNGIYATYCEPMDIIGNHLVTCGNASYSSIHLANTRYNRIMGNKIEHDGTSNSAHGIEMESASYSDVIGNTITGANIGYYEYAAMMLMTAGIVVMGNIISETYGDGMAGPGCEGACIGNYIYYPGQNGITTGWQDSLLEGNYIQNPTFNGIEIWSERSRVVNNKIVTSQMHGILQHDNYGGVISGNEVYNSSHGATNVYTAIFLTGARGDGVEGTIISDNYLYSGDYPKKQAYSIWEAESHCNYNIIHDNMCHGSVRQEIAAQGLYTKVHDNIVNF